MLLSHIYQVTIFTFSYQVWVHYFTLLLLFLLLMFPKSLHIVVDSTHFNFHGQRSNDATKSVPQGIIFYEYHCVCLGHTQMEKSGEERVEFLKGQKIFFLDKSWRTQ